MDSSTTEGSLMLLSPRALPKLKYMLPSCAPVTSRYTYANISGISRDQGACALVQDSMSCVLDSHLSTFLIDNRRRVPIDITPSISEASLLALIHPELVPDGCINPLDLWIDIVLHHRCLRSGTNVKP
jgi:hypothetical protein